MGADQAGLIELTKDFDRSAVAGISFGGQMHGLVVLDENDNVIRPAILWNDGRTQKETDYLNNVIGKEKLSEAHRKYSVCRIYSAKDFMAKSK